MSSPLASSLLSLTRLSGVSYEPAVAESLPAATPIPPRVGEATAPTPAVGGAGSGGIAGPLSETDYTDREWHPERTLTSSDGVLTIRFRALKQIKMLDANGAELVFEYKDAESG